MQNRIPHDSIEAMKSLKIYSQIENICETGVRSIVERRGEKLGRYLNSRAAYTLYKSETEKPYFVDKSEMLQELFPLVRTGNNHICITRPRRFGKTVAANMIAAFFPVPATRRTFLSRFILRKQKATANTGTGFPSSTFLSMSWTADALPTENISNGSRKDWSEI